MVITLPTTAGFRINLFQVFSDMTMLVRSDTEKISSRRELHFNWYMEPHDRTICVDNCIVTSVDFTVAAEWIKDT